MRDRICEQESKLVDVIFASYSLHFVSFQGLHAVPLLNRAIGTYDSADEASHWVIDSSDRSVP